MVIILCVLLMNKRMDEKMSERVRLESIYKLKKARYKSCLLLLLSVGIVRLVLKSD